MIIELQIFKYRVVLTAAKTEVIEGVYSLLDHDMHFLMWDFDDVTLDEVKESLIEIKNKFELPDIHILETKKGEGYHGYCMSRVCFQRACEILAATTHIDMRFYTAGVMRHKWTLRLSEKTGRGIKHVCDIWSVNGDTVKIEDIKHFCHYKTPGDGHKTKIIKIGGQ